MARNFNKKKERGRKGDQALLRTAAGRRRGAEKGEEEKGGRSGNPSRFSGAWAQSPSLRCQWRAGRWGGYKFNQASGGLTLSSS